MAKRLTVEFNAKVTPVKPLNDEFTLCKCYVMALDKNRNLSYIGKEAADNALPTLFNIPVIGHLYVDDEGKYHMGGHDMTIVQNSDGKYEFKSICVPYGVVPQQDNVHYEDVQEPNGDTHTYIVSDVILWTGRFPELQEAVYGDQTYFGQSMEINVNEHKPLEEDKNYTNILSYTYSALCLLGKSDNAEQHVEPCFPMARVEPYEFSLDDDKFSELMLQLKSELACCFDNHDEKKGEDMEDIVTTEQIETNETAEFVETQTNGEDVSVGAETAETIESFEAGAGASTDEDSNETQSFSSTYEELRDALRDALPRTEEYDEEGRTIHYTSYWLCDFDDNFVFVERNEWKRGEGHSETKGRFAYTFDEEHKKATVSDNFEEMFVRWLTRDELTQIESMRAQYEELVQYRADRERADREAEFDSAISEFSYLEENEEFQAVSANRYSYASVEDLKNACYIVKGKYSIQAPASRPKSTTEPIIPVGDTTTPATLHERFHERFGKK